jgi:hypothetical protein
MIRYEMPTRILDGKTRKRSAHMKHQLVDGKMLKHVLKRQKCESLD